MTITAQLPSQLEHSLRQRCAQEGRNISEIVCDALTTYLAQAPSSASAWSLGEVLFGRYSGPEGLAENRKAELEGIWADKQANRT
jgi:hypothetical protein